MVGIHIVLAILSHCDRPENAHVEIQSNLTSHVPCLAFHCAIEPKIVLLIAEFITLEYRCCPCFTLGLEAQKERGPLWLKVTGREGIKAFIQTAFGIQ